MNESLDLIEVSARYETEIEAHEAELYVTVKGSSLFTGTAAFDKAKEVARLVEALATVGVARTAVTLRAVSAEVSSGLLSRSSSATYELAIRCTDLDRLPDVLGEVSAAKQATLDSIEWHYPSTSAQKAEWLARCVAETNVKAQAIAQALPATIVGVHRVREVVPVSKTPYDGAPMLEAEPTMRRRSVALGFPLGQRTSMSVTLVAEYRIVSQAR